MYRFFSRIIVPDRVCLGITILKLYPIGCIALRGYEFYTLKGIIYKNNTIFVPKRV